MFHFHSLREVPVQGGRGRWEGGGLVEWEGRVVWGGRDGVFMWEKGEWTKIGGALGGTLTVCEGRLVYVGGHEDGNGSSKQVRELRGGIWSTWPWSHMLVGCHLLCVVSVSGGGMVVMGGISDRVNFLNEVQVFDGETKTWQKGPSLPQPCWVMSAVVHEDQIFVMGGSNINKAVWCANIHDLTTTRDTQQSVWRKLPDVPYYCSSVSMIDGVLLSIGGAEDPRGLRKTSSIYGFDSRDQKWKHVGDMPSACSWVDTLLSGGELFVVDGSTQQVWKMTVKVPSPPVDITAHDIKATSMTVSWLPPHHANGIITLYEVSYTPQIEIEYIHDVDSDITSTELTSLKPNTEYTIRVRAKTVEFGDNSSPIYAKTLPDGPHSIVFCYISMPTASLNKPSFWCKTSNLP